MPEDFAGSLEGRWSCLAGAGMGSTRMVRDGLRKVAQGCVASRPAPGAIRRHRDMSGKSWSNILPAGRLPAYRLLVLIGGSVNSL